ncbi:MAG TPA: PPC domain-containing DNA-binding protein [Flavipsychrobacter sp.]
MKYLYLFIIMLLINNSSNAQDITDKYRKTPTGYILVLRMGDSIIPAIEQLAQREQIPFANFTGIGFVNVQFGYYNFKKKTYKPKDFADVEMAGMTGSIAWKEGKPSIHAHGVVTGKNFKAYGGHILKGTVSTGSLEIYITVHDAPLQRKEDPAIGGANVLRVKDGE